MPCEVASGQSVDSQRQVGGTPGPFPFHHPSPPSEVVVRFATGHAAISQFAKWEPVAARRYLGRLIRGGSPVCDTPASRARRKPCNSLPHLVLVRLPHVGADRFSTSPNVAHGLRRGTASDVLE